MVLPELVGRGRVVLQEEQAGHCGAALDPHRGRSVVSGCRRAVDDHWIVEIQRGAEGDGAGDPEPDDVLRGRASRSSPAVIAHGNEPAECFDARERGHLVGRIGAAATGELGTATRRSITAELPPR